MQLIADGPDIPTQVIEAHRDGNLLLFCGAGISVPAGLPTFARLVELVAAELGESLVAHQAELDSGQFDRILARLERRYPSFLRPAIARLLACSPEADVSTHRALRSLAFHHVHGLRLVTTNFDDLFERVRKPSDPPLAAAPALPVPKPGRWRGIVHLHGRIQLSDAGHENLVLTSSDFGVAYLTEGWASRFVTEAFNHFVVLFVGYAANDPVMRYLIDALAAERKRDTRVRQAFALAAASPGAFTLTEAEWNDKNITPILYAEDASHSKLHATLVAWARMWELGDQSRRQIVRDYAEVDPNKLGPEHLSQVFWAVGDDDGIGADEFASIGRSSHLGWLEFFEKQGLLAGATTVSRSNALVDGGSSAIHVTALARSTAGLGRWLACHLASPDVFRWALRRGGVLHPQFSFMIDTRLSDSDVAPMLQRAWRLLLDGPVAHTQGHDTRAAPLSLRPRISSDSWGVELRAAFSQLLEPVLALSAPYGGHDRGSEHPQSLSEIVSGDCKLRAGHSLSAYLQRARSRPDWNAVITDLSLDLVVKLRDALDLLARLDRASDDYDSSYIERRSLKHGPGQFVEIDDWIVLVDLLIEATSASAAIASQHALIVAEVCAHVPYPIFRRLALHFSSRGSWPTTDTILDRLTTDADRWLWSFHVQHELFAWLSSVWTKLDAARRAQLSSALLAGPSKGLFHPDLSESEISEAADRLLWKRLSLLSRTSPGLDTEAMSRLTALQSAHEDWVWDGADPPESFSESQTIRALDASTQDALRAMPIDEVVAILGEHGRARSDLAEQWYGAAGQDPQWALWVLARLHTMGEVPAEIWASGLHGISRTADLPLLTEVALAVPHLLPDLALSRMTRQLAYMLDSISRDLDPLKRSAFVHAWDQVRQAARHDPSEHAEDIHSAAINHSLGILVECLLNLVRSEGRVRGSGLPDDVRDRLSGLASEVLPSGRMARVAIASRIQWLHDLDAAWTLGTLGAYFDWASPLEAQAMWCGVVHSGPMRPSLFAALKSSFLAAFHRFGEFDRQSQRLITNLLVSFALESPEALNAEEARAAFTRLDDDHRAFVAWTLGRKLKDAGDRAADFWLSTVGPWISRTWPKAEEAKGALASDRLAEIALMAGSAFSQAVADVRLFVIPLRNEHDVAGLLQEISENSIAETFPDAALDLVDAVTPMDARAVEHLSRILDTILSVKPSLADDPRVRRLKDNAASR